MDFATVIGLVAGIAIIFMAMASGSSIDAFVNVPGLLIVLGGTFAATLIKFPMKDTLRAFPLAFRKAFRQGVDKPGDLVREAHRLASIVGQSNLLALDEQDIKNEFFQKGVDLCVDGHSADFVRNVLEHEMELSIERLDVGEKVFRAMGDAAPAFGLVAPWSVWCKCCRTCPTRPRSVRRWRWRC